MSKRAKPEVETEELMDRRGPLASRVKEPNIT